MKDIITDLDSLGNTALQSVRTTLCHENDAITRLSKQYQDDEFSQTNIVQSLKIFYNTNAKGGKIVCCGIGKSFKIASKLVATMKSLSIKSDLLHPSEALHGDLGLLDDQDCLVLFTASGNTPELINLLPHVSPSIPVVLLTCLKTSKLGLHPQVLSFLYAELPSHLKEDLIHGVPAPTVSTTLALVLGDAVVLALSEMIEKDSLKRKTRFSTRHPGGSIGMDLSHLNANFHKASAGSSEVSPTQRPEDRGSFSSLLSLNQIRDCTLADTNRSDITSLTSENDESTKETDSTLLKKIKNALFCQVLSVPKDEFVSWSENDLLKNITIYDYILFTKEKESFALESSEIRSFYRSLASSKGPLPENFVEQLSDSFKSVSL